MARCARRKPWKSSSRRLRRGSTRKSEKGVEWLANYAILGPYDYLDIFRAPDVETAMKVATIVRTFGHAHTEVWAATEWKQFKEMVRNLPAAEG